MSRRGFGTVRRLPSGRYQASHMHEDTRHTAPWTFQTKLDAGAWLAQRQADITRGAWPPPAGTAPAVRVPTFREWAAVCLRDRPLAAKTRENYAGLLRHIEPAFGALPLTAITTSAVRAWNRHLDTGPTQRANAYVLLASIMRSAVREHLIPASPCVLQGATTRKRQHKIEPADQYQIDAIATAMPDRLRMMVELAAWCALRLGELTALRRRDIEMDPDLKHGAVLVRRSVVWLRSDGLPHVKGPKSEAGERDVEIPPHLLPSLERHLERHVLPGRDALLFPAGRDPHAYIHPGTVTQAFKRARNKAGRPDLRFHDLRHTGLTMAAQEGATTAELMHRAGHSSPEMAMRYQHATRDRDRALAARLSERTAP